MALNKNQVSEIRSRLNAGEKVCNLAKEFGVSQSYVSQIKSQKKGAKQVWLTIEEAKVVNRALAFGLAVSESLRDQNDFEDLAVKIDKQIEQVEKNHGT